MEKDQRNFAINKDELTGLLEKQTFYMCCQELIDTLPEEANYAFIFFDIENFKLFNANYGYEKGDELLKEVASIINEVFKDQLISRFTGDHFVVFTNTTQIVPLIKHVRKRVKMNQINLNLELKAGIFVVEDHKLEAKRCCDRARMACVSIKKRYDLEYRFYDDELDGIILHKQFILDNLDEAIEKGYIKPFYQPMIRTLTGKMCAWEVLVRWMDPVKGMIFPNEFIPVLEEYRLIPKMDQYVIEQAIKKVATLTELGESVVPVSVNLSRVDFEVLNMVSFMDELMHKYNCPRHMCHLEVTESVVTENPAFIMAQVKALREHGYEVWMDDFGSGYSSLNGLKSFEFDLAKIDMGFLKDFEETDNGKIILKHIVSLVKNLGIHTLIEGVETNEQLDFMTKLGCEIVQGYLIGRPLPYDEAMENLQKKEIEFETYEERNFYNAIGMVDVLRQNPLQNIGKNLTRNPLPLAIGIVQDGKWRHIYTNLGYLKEIESSSGGTVVDAEKMINKSEKWARKNGFWELLKHAKESLSQESMDFVESGRITNIRVRFIAEDKVGGVDAYLISVKNVSRLSNDSLDERMNLINRCMFSFYECVDLFGISEDYFENLYLESSRLHIKFTKKSANEVMQELATKRVHVEDKERFLEFLNLKTAEKRLKNERQGKKIEVFRILNVNGEYEWKAVIISLFNYNGILSLLSCVSTLDRAIMQNLDVESIDNVAEPLNGLSVDDVIENVLKLIPLGIFWKDKERRFMGANKMFLDYYGFSSVNSIIGRTDEDMGWHINPEPFKKVELEVINEGKAIENVPGECIVRGEVRAIMASKRPFVIDGEIVGLIGFFRDVTGENTALLKLEQLSITDELTGVYNRRGFNEIIGRYEEQYYTNNADFALFMMDVDKFKQINDMYGHEFGDVILQTVCKKLRMVASEKSVVFRYGGDEFVILHQYKNPSEIDDIKQDITLQMQEIKKIDGADVKVRLSVGVATYSEVEDMNLLVNTADKRMYDDKMNKKKH